MGADDSSSAWPAIPLSDECHFKLIMGQSPPGSTYNEVGEGLPFFQGKADFGEKSPTARVFCSAPTRIAEPDDVLISVRAPVGPTNLADKQCAIGRGLAAIRCKNGVAPRYLLTVLRALEAEIAHLAEGQGGGFNCLRKEQLAEFKIPVPPLREQQQIIARVEAFTSRIGELTDHTRVVGDAVDRTLAVFYERIIDGAPVRPFSKVAKLVRRSVKTTLDGYYGEMGIRSFGKGTFPKPVLTGAQLGNKRVFRICAGDLVFMNVFAWEGAIAVAQANDDGRVGSHRFLTHEVDSDLATPEFLCFHFLTPQGLEDIGAASPGSAGRNRTLGIDKLAEIDVPVPAIEAQRRFTRMSRLQHELTRLQREVESELAVFMPALLAKAFRGELCS